MEKRETLQGNLISQKELCEHLGIDRYTVYRAIKKGNLHPIMVKGQGNKNFFDKEEIEKWVNS